MRTIPSILCIEPDVAVLDTRCAVLRHNGYDTYRASRKVTEVVLATHSFDLIILSSNLTDAERHRVTRLAAGTQTLALRGVTLPSTLLAEVSKRLLRFKWSVA